METLSEESKGETMELRRIFQMGWVPAAIFVLILLSSYPAMADTCEKWVARAVSVQGTVQALRPGEKQWVPVRLHDLFCPGDRIRVLAQSRADLLLINESTLRLDQNTTVTFSPPETEKTSLIELLKGAVHFFSRQRRNLRVVTPFVNATVEGTEFYMTVETDRTFLSVFEGRVVASNQGRRNHSIEGSIRDRRRRPGPSLTNGRTAPGCHSMDPLLLTCPRLSSLGFPDCFPNVLAGPSSKIA